MCDLNFTAQFLYFPLALFVTLDDSECKILHIEGSADQDMGFLAPVIQRTPVYSLKANVPTKGHPHLRPLQTDHGGNRPSPAVMVPSLLPPQGALCARAAFQTPWACPSCPPTAAKATARPAWRRCA